MNIFKPANILIPTKTDLSKWSVVACDQSTSQPDYWEKVSQLAGDSPSTLNLIFPEVYLNNGDDDKRIENINKTMSAYLSDNIFTEFKDSFILVERTQSNGKIRKGIIGCMDLEEYDFSKGSKSKIRATEGTILSRIPPRQKIRRNAPLEFPHILMLIDDRNKTVIEPVSDSKNSLEKLYDFDLMQGGGHIRGYLVNEEMKSNILSALDVLNDKDAFNQKYGTQDEEVLLYAAGDGNHSLATAKACWEELKKTLSPQEQLSHPARFALVELNNIHDDALEFEPIQRVVFGVDPENVMDCLFDYYDASFQDNGGQEIRYTYMGNEGVVYIKNGTSNLPVGTLQKFLDDYIKKHGGEVDYIHGDDVVRELTTADNTIGFMVDKMEKNDLFTTVIKDGALPRKTFSMGEACDKRFYLEGKRIR